MANFELARPAPFGAITIHRAVSLVKDGFEAVVDWANTRATRRALNKLPDAVLYDIGLERADIAKF